MERSGAGWSTGLAWLVALLLAAGTACGGGGGARDEGDTARDDGAGNEVAADDVGADGNDAAPDTDGTAPDTDDTGAEADVTDAGDGEADAMPSCARDGEACGSAPFCCPGTLCAAGVCRPEPAGLGESCSADRPCNWLGGVCRDGICACSGAGASCANDEECCPGEGPCVGGSCAGACAVGGSGSYGNCYDIPCCGQQGFTECTGNCDRPADWREELAPGCLDLVWDGMGLHLPVCASDEQCCPWLGPCVAGLCGACLVAGSTCGRDLDCCSGRCEGGACAGTSCRHRGETCAADAECCTPPCAGGRCGCLPPGSSCTRAEECCTGPCAGGTCGDGCPATCATDADCCAAFLCHAGRCLPARPDDGPVLCTVDAQCTGPWFGSRSRCDRGVCYRFCSGYGARNLPDPVCRADSDCCDGNYCNAAAGRCVPDCGGEGASCGDDSQCCEGATPGGTYCDRGTCTRCRGLGAACADWTQCCSWFCDAGLCAGACSGIGDVCMSAGECCDAGALCMGSPPAPQTCCFPDGHTCTRPEECCGLCDGTTCIPRPPGP